MNGRERVAAALQAAGLEVDAAGHHRAVFPVPFRTLAQITEGQVADLTEAS